MKKLSVLFICILSFCFLSCSTPTTTKETTTIINNDKKDTSNGGGNQGDGNQNDGGSQGGQNETPQPIPRDQWDADNIYMTNTPSAPDLTNNWLFTRQLGSTGIIGKFVQSYEQTLNQGHAQHTTVYVFNDTGYYTFNESGYANSNVSSPFSVSKSGTFVISKDSNNSCYKIVLHQTKQNGVDILGQETKYFKVNNEKLQWNNVAF